MAISKSRRKDQSDQEAGEERYGERTIGKSVGAVVAAAAVIRVLHRSERPLRASDVARDAGLHRGTAFNILRTLQREGYVTYSERDRTYSVGILILELAHGVLLASGLLDVVRPEMFSLAERVGVTVAIGKVTDDKDLILLDFVGGTLRIDSYFSVGRRSRRFSGASGLVMAAFSGAPIELVKEQYEYTEWFRRPPLDEYLERVEQTRQQGFSLDRGNKRSGLTQVAAPIFSQNGALALVLTVADFSYAMDDERISLVAREVLAFSDRMSSESGRLRLP